MALCWMLQRVGRSVGRCRALSTVMPPRASLPPLMPPSDSLVIPTRHSRKKLPHVITDHDELMRHADTILAAEIGSLYTYTDELVDRDAAWRVADTSVQTVEAVLRGFAWHVDGTMWNRYWTNVEKELALPQTKDIVIAMEELVERLYQEGLAYMQIRSGRLQELDEQKNYQLVATESETSNLFDDEKYSSMMEEEEKEEKAEIPKSLFEPSPPPSGGGIFAQQRQEDVKDAPYFKDFALPGPTTVMYDAMLDVAAILGDANLRESVKTWHETIWARHELDGGCLKNDNEFTRPTAVSYNAVIRYASNLPTGNIEVRDDAVTMAFAAFQMMEEIDCVHRNSASAEYLLLMISKFMPPSRSRGNIAAGVFHQARYHGLISPEVVEAYKKTNIPSNSEEDDEFVQKSLTDIPIKWKRNSKKYRHNKRDSVY